MGPRRRSKGKMHLSDAAVKPLLSDRLHVVKVEAAGYLSVPHIDNAHTSDGESLSRLKHVLIRATERPLNASVPIVHGGAQHLDP